MEEYYDNNEVLRVNRRPMLWASIFVFGLFIIVGWVYFTKISFERIDDRLKVNSVLTNEEAQATFTETLNGLQIIIDETRDGYAAAVAGDEAAQVQAAQEKAAREKLIRELKQQPLSIPTASPDASTDATNEVTEE